MDTLAIISIRAVGVLITAVGAVIALIDIIARVSITSESVVA
jgi:hypothetical protein